MNIITSNERVSKNELLPENKIVPTIHPTSTIRNSVINGNVIIEENVHIVNAAIRADEGTPFYIGKGSNIQDFAVLHGYVTQQAGTPIEQNLVFIEGKGYFSIYISENVTIAHGALVHGPSCIEESSFIGFKATIDAANIGANSEIGAHSYIKGVDIPANIGIAPNSIITKQEDIEQYIVPITGINEKVISVNHEMAEAYNKTV